MSRVGLYNGFKGLLKYTDEQHPMECKVTIGENEAVGLNSNELPVVTSIFYKASEGNIWFNIEGYSEPIEFNTLSDSDLENIIKYFMCNELPR